MKTFDPRYYRECFKVKGAMVAATKCLSCRFGELGHDWFTHPRADRKIHCAMDDDAGFRNESRQERRAAL